MKRRREIAVSKLFSPMFMRVREVEALFSPSQTRMDTVDSQSQVGESRITVADLSSVYAGFEAKVKKSISIMVVSGEADNNGKTETDSHRILRRRMALWLPSQAGLQVDAHPPHPSQVQHTQTLRHRCNRRHQGGAVMAKSLKVTKQSGDNTYCGPAALSIITGKPVSEVMRILHTYVLERRRVRGMWNHEMESCLWKMGYETRLVQLPLRMPTVAQWLRNERKPDDTFLVQVSHHYIVVRGRKIADNRNPEGVFLRQYQHRRSRVHKVWHVYRPPKSAYLEARLAMSKPQEFRAGTRSALFQAMLHR